MMNSNSVINNVFEEIIITEIVDNIINNTEYRTNILNKSKLYFNTIDVINNALPIYERNEEYETCAYLVKFKEKVVDKAKEKLEKN